VSLAVLDRVALAFGKKTILQDLNLRVAEGDRIGLIGPNGSGKTSLLRLLAGEQVPDYGAVSFARGTRIGYLPQDLDVTDPRPLLRVLMESVGGRSELDREIAACEADLRAAEASPGDGSTLMTLAERLGELHERVTHHEMHYTEHEALRILRGLGFAVEDRDRPLSEFSGGWKMRAILASLLFQKPDLLLLDEPTNHLDMPSVTWLTDFLTAYRRAFILICHDREFLNEQIRRIVSFEVEGVRQYASNYERYLVLREEEEVVLENQAKNVARVRADAERFIERFRAQANKAKSVQSRVKALDRMEEVQTFQRRKVMRVKFPPTERAVSEPLRLEGVGKSFGDKVVLRDVNLKVQRGERIAIIGVNGAGKTTLLRMIANEIEASAGKITLGGNVRLGHYAQHHAETLNREWTVYQEVQALDPSTSVTRVRSVLGAFLFSDDDVDKKIAVLSGGERARVALARLLIKPGNLLLMDEPTNHLDLASAEALAASLEEYDGTLVLVSHNRSFVRRLATRIWNVADGHVETYPGTLDEYMDSCRRRQDAADGGVATPVAKKVVPPAREVRGAARGEPTAATGRSSPAEVVERQRQKQEERRVRKIDDEIATLEGRIATLEAAQKERSALLADPEVYADRERSGKLLTEFRDAQGEVERLTARWEQAHGERESPAAGAPGNGGPASGKAPTATGVGAGAGAAPETPPARRRRIVGVRSGDPESSE
jgi:ATP-binding cassette subfamily F protein 3